MAASALAPAAIGAPAYAAVANKLSDRNDAKLRKTAQDFEAMFLENAFGQMFSGLKGEGPLGDNGPGADAWRGMLTQEYAKTVAKAGGVGVADAVYRELLRMQEGRGAKAAKTDAVAGAQAALVQGRAQGAASLAQDTRPHGL